MSTRTVTWAALTEPASADSAAEGLRERKKRLTRQHLSDVATQLFLERGFDAVRVAEVAEACGVSEKTVYNYFPTKESLMLDRFDASMASLRVGLATPGVSPVEAVLRIIDLELGALTSWLAEEDDLPAAIATIRRFGEVVRSTPSLAAFQRDMTDELTAVAAEVMAERAGVNADEPEPQIAATALLGLWTLHWTALRKYLDGTRTPEEARVRVMADVHRAARLLDTGLWTFGMFVQGSRGRAAFQSGADSAEKSRSQVTRAITQARRESERRS